MPLMLPRPAHTLTGGGMNGKAASIEEQIAAATASKVRRVRDLAVTRHQLIRLVLAGDSSC